MNSDSNFYYSVGWLATHAVAAFWATMLFLKCLGWAAKKLQIK